MAWERGWLLLLPFLAVFAHWAASTWRHWSTFGLRLDTSPYTVTLHDSGLLHAQHLLRSAATGLRHVDPLHTTAGRSVRAVELFVAESDLAQLEGNLPYSGDDFVDATMRCGGTEHEVRVRHRGDNLPHWGHFKKSYRVRVRKGGALDGMVEFNLVVAKLPEQHNNLLASELAAALGVMAPRTELAQVWLNGRFHGLYELVEQLGAQTLRNHGRVPGAIHSGDLVLRDAWTGTPNRVFENALQWEVVGAVGVPTAAVRAPLVELVRVLNEPWSESVLERLEQLVDIEAFARFSALEVLTQSHHDDETHNWRLHHDPATGRFEPIVWDLMPWGETSRIADGGGPELDPVFSHLHEALHCHAGFLAERHRVLDRFFATGGDTRLLAAVDARFATALELLRADRNAMPQDDAAIRDAMAGMRRYLVDTLDGVRTALAAGAGARWSVPEGEGRGLLLAVGGPGVLGRVELRFRSPLSPGSLRLRLQRDGAVQELPLVGRWQHGGSSLFVELDLVAARARLLGRRAGANQARCTRRVLEPAVVELVGEDVEWDQLVEVRGDGRVLALDRKLQLLPCSDLHRLVVARDAGPLLVSGAWDIAGAHVVRHPVRIAPGTVVRLAPGATLRFESQLVAEGTAEQPVRFVPAADAPWGAVAFVGEGASGSVLRHCEFLGGSRHTDPVAPLEAMVSVQATRLVRFVQCTFRDAPAAALQVQLLAADAEFDQCRFEAAAQDALGADTSRLAVRGCTFLGAGADALRLWASSALVTDSTFVRTGRCAVVLHDGARALVLRTRVDAAVVGMSARDGSVLHAANCALTQCSQPLLAESTEPRHRPGGTVHLLQSTVGSSPSQPAVDRASAMALVGCGLGWQPAGSDLRLPDGSLPRGRIVHEAVRSESSRRLPVELLDAVPGAMAAWQTIRDDVRGIP